MSDFKLNFVNIRKISEVNGIVEVKVALSVTFRDYVINRENNKVKRGSKNIYFANVYELTYIKGINEKLTNCPTCGVPIEVISSNKCEYCKSTIVQNSNELVLSEKNILLCMKRRKF